MSPVQLSKVCTPACGTTFHMTADTRGHSRILTLRHLAILFAVYEGRWRHLQCCVGQEGDSASPLWYCLCCQEHCCISAELCNISLVVDVTTMGCPAEACISEVQIKMKVEQSREDKILAQKRQKLLAFLNSSVE